MFYLASKHSDQSIVNFVLDELKKQGLKDAEIETQIINGKFDKTKSTPLIRAC